MIKKEEVMCGNALGAEFGGGCDLAIGGLSLSRTPAL